MIMLQNVIPIALYVSIEFVKSWHAYWIYQDVNMYYKLTDQRCMARNWNISDDLGQVSYIFSDKTGTLTRNVMDFRMCSINGTIYGKQLPGDELDVVKGRMAQEEVDRNNPLEGGTNPFFMEIQNEEDDYEMSEHNRPSTNASIGSAGTNQYDHSPLISTADAPANRHNATPQHSIAPATSVPIGAVRSRGRTVQAMSDEEAQARRKVMISSYLSAMRKVFDPKYVEVGDEETGEGGAYTFVDPQIFYDMKPEVAPAHRVATPSAGEGIALAPHTVRRVVSHRSISHGFDVNPARQRDMVDLFLTELATCHSVVVEKSFQKHIVHEDADDRSTLQRLTRIFHRRNSSKRVSDMMRHVRTRSRHARTASAITTSSAGEGVEWVPSEVGATLPRMGHSHSASSGSVAFMRSGDTSAGDERFGLTSPVRGSALRLADDAGPLSPDALPDALEPDAELGAPSPHEP
ncbi:phospholipid transporting ATPase, partial [Coemansia aciculifera]